MIRGGEGKKIALTLGDQTAGSAGRVGTGNDPSFVHLFLVVTFV